MLVVKSERGVPIRLTDERWQHITERHPEMTDFKEQVIGAISRPDMIQQGDAGELLAVTFQPETPFGEKHVVVSYRELAGEDDGFVITAYLTRRPSRTRRVLWRRVR